MSAPPDGWRAQPRALAVGAETLAAITSEERTTIEDFIEPYLLQIGLLERTPRGRKVTGKTYTHLGKSLPEQTSSQGKLL